MKKTKDYFDKLVEKYETKDFINSDPIQFPHRYNSKKDVEIAAFIASIYAYGKREVFISKLSTIFDIMNNKPYEFVKNFTVECTLLDNCDYRFSRGIDLKQIILTLGELYSNNYSLETLFSDAWNKTKTIDGMLQIVVDYFYVRVTLPVTKGFYHLLPDPKNGSACKRLNMFLRWMVRDGIVDLGLWKFIPQCELIIPLDVHVAKISRQQNLLTRKQNDWKSAKELTKKLSELCPNDPTKYDFAMFGYGVNN